MSRSSQVKENSNNKRPIRLTLQRDIQTVASLTLCEQLIQSISSIWAESETDISQFKLWEDFLFRLRQPLFGWDIHCLSDNFPFQLWDEFCLVWDNHPLQLWEDSFRLRQHLFVRETTIHFRWDKRRLDVRYGVVL